MDSANHQSSCEGQSSERRAKSWRVSERVKATTGCRASRSLPFLTTGGILNLTPLLLIILATILQTRALELNISQASIAEDNLEKLIDSIEPRQYFKVAPSSGPVEGDSEAGELAGVASRRVSKGISLRSALEPLLASEAAPEERSAGQKSSKLSGQAKQKGISNATLKKLLNQSLLKANSTSASGGPKSSNFKFVFIQRATSAPSLSKEKDAGKGKLGAGTTKTTASGWAKDGKQSLASSVSKQLASSLLYNAVSNLVNNSAAPSLSSLASQIVATSLEAATGALPASSGAAETNPKPVSEASGSPTSAPAKPEGLSTEESREFRRPQAAQKKLETPFQKRKQAVKRKQSKIYNLPVKFVSNGQPNMVVFNAIKQHFAAIKKLQQATSKLHNQYQHSAGNLSSSRLTKSRRPLGSAAAGSGSNALNKVKGVNSRLIYLPLKYLSNARPSKILVAGRATHKSSSN